MTDAEWDVLQPEAEQVMAQIRLAPGRPMDHLLRPMFDGVRYLVRNGIEWRALPVDFPPWEAVYAFHDRWSRRDLPQRLCHRYRDATLFALTGETYFVSQRAAEGSHLRAGLGDMPGA